MAIAGYSWYRNVKPLSFEDIGGDPRNNIQHAMNKIDSDKVTNILIGIIKDVD